VIELDARPLRFRFEPAHAALVIIDMQRDFVEPVSAHVSMIEPPEAPR
jgi:isochorismate hydrolase